MVAAGDRSIRVLIHNPDIRSDRAIFYFHGGGWIVGSPSTHADISEALALTTGLPVISIDYRLAPEHKADAAIDDGLAVISHFLAAPGNFTSGILAGDSAGGSIALATASRAQSMGLKITGALSFYGSFGLTANPGLYQVNSAREALDAISVRRYWLAANASTAQSPYSIPVLARSVISPVYVMAGGRDPLRDDSLALARALRAGGRTVTVDIHPFEGHSFLQDRHRRHAGKIAYRRLAFWIAGLPHEDPPC